MKRIGCTFRIVLSTIAAAALLAGATAPSAAAAAADGGVEELWEEFPLDERQAPAPRTRATDEGGATARASDPAERRSAARPANEGSRSWASDQIGLLAAILALLVAAAAAGVARTRDAWPGQNSKTTRPTLRWPPHLVPSPAVSPVGSDVVGDLLRVASAGVPRRRSAKVGQRPGGLPRMARAETGDGKPLPEALKQPTTEAEAEAEVLKRKGSADSKLALKASETGLKPKSDDDARAKEQLASTEGVVLKEKLEGVVPKEKLAPKTEEKRSAAPVKNGRLGRRAKSRARRESALRPVPATGAERQPRVRGAARETRTRTCQVEWCRGGVKSAFFAIETSSGWFGRTRFGRTIAWSPYFHWSNRGVPRETPEAAAALRSLVESLEREGWIVAGRREEWFRVKFKWARDVDAPETVGGHQSHTG